VCCEPLNTLLNAIAMPRRGELQVSALRAAISREMNRIDERQFLDASYCDEIVNTALMEIATGESLRWQGLEADDEEWRLAISDLRVSQRMLNLTTVTAEECNGSCGDGAMRRPAGRNPATTHKFIPANNASVGRRRQCSEWRLTQWFHIPILFRRPSGSVLGSLAGQNPRRLCARHRHPGEG